MALPDKNRLKKKKDFDLVFKKGNAVKGNFLFFRYLSKIEPVSRIGFIIPAKVIGRAVDRNRIKRLLSEIVRNKIRDFKGSYDVVMMLRKSGTKDNFLEELNRFFRTVT